MERPSGSNMREELVEVRQRLPTSNTLTSKRLSNTHEPSSRGDTVRAKKH